mgnify:CR=1 FL=1
MKVNTTAIAQALNISRSTVSKALNNRPEVRDETKEMVLNAAKKMGYKKLVDSANTPKKDICLLIHEDEASNNFWSMILRGAENYLSSNGFRIFFGVINGTEEKQGIIPAMLSTNNMPAGIIMIGSYRCEYYSSIRRLGLPVVATDMPADMKDNELLNDIVFMNGESSVYEITKNLIDSGISDIAFVGDINWSRSIRERWNGYKLAILENDLKLNRDYDPFVYTERQDHFEDIAENLYRVGHFPKAFVCANDVVALRLIGMLEEKGFRVPEDIVVTGFDNFTLDAVTPKNLTTVSYDISAIGYLAARQILWRVDNPDMPYMITRINSKVIYANNTKHQTK